MRSQKEIVRRREANRAGTAQSSIGPVVDVQVPPLRVHETMRAWAVGTRGWCSSAARTANAGRAGS
jgi:hypothetical protein